MQATIVHESRGRMRLRLRQKNISIRQADLLETWLKGQPWTREAVVHERTCCVIVTYTETGKPSSPPSVRSLGPGRSHPSPCPATAPGL